ncbi:MAG: hypothetical protein RLZZ113_1372, partial [Pseudomonadota bacterium]
DTHCDCESGEGLSLLGISHAALLVVGQ